MNKTCFRFYGGLTVSQEKWLNKMSRGGWRLVRTGKLLYEFEPCEAGRYQYRVEFVGHKSREDADDYARFLTECGCRVWFKNINLNWNVGKTVYRPWAEKGGRIATNRTTYNRELLIAEKEADGKPFELHSTFEDRIAYGRSLRRTWIFLFLFALFFAVFSGIMLRTWTGILLPAIFALLASAGLIACQVQLNRLKKQAKTQEW